MTKHAYLKMTPDALIELLSKADNDAREVVPVLTGRLDTTPEGCILWAGGMTGAGQPVTRISGRQVALPRFIWNATHPGQLASTVFRTCRNPRCISPDHLSTTQPDTGAELARRLLESIPAESQACVVWPGTRSTQGYGVLSQSGKRVPVHRWVWQQAFGQVPSGHVIAHACAEPLCLNPAHLICCTPAERVQITVEQRHFPHGEQHWNHKVTATQASDIKSSPAPTQDLVKRYPLSRSGIKNIRAGRSWAKD